MKGTSQHRDFYCLNLAISEPKDISRYLLLLRCICELSRTGIFIVSDVAAQVKQGDASGERTQGFVEKMDKDYVPSDEAKATPDTYDGPATRTRATSDSPPDPYTTEVPEPPSDM